MKKTCWNSIPADDLHKIRHELLPEPYLGRVDAEIVLLNLNPGFSKDDHLLYEQAYARTAWERNILHQTLEYPFFLLDPTLKGFPGPQWWLATLKEPIEIAGLKIVANRMCCIEYFPYHSKKFGWKGEFLESQKYCFHLVELAIMRGALLITMRGSKRWCEAVPLLGNYKRKYELNSAQNVAISRRNCPEGFPIIEKILRSDKSI